MELFLEIALGMPTGIFSGMLTILSIYWCFTLLGVLDIDLFGLDGFDGLDGDGLLEGGAESVDGLLDSVGDNILDGALESVDAIGGDGISPEALDLPSVTNPILIFLNVFHLQAVPITISLSLLTLMAWSISYAGSRFWMDVFPNASLGAFGIGVGSVLLSLILTGQLLKPFEGKLVTHQVKDLDSYLGSSCTILSSKVNAQFGEAKIPNPQGAPLIMQVRCNKENTLKKGDEALVISKEGKHLIVEALKTESKMPQPQKQMDSI